MGAHHGFGPRDDGMGEGGCVEEGGEVVLEGHGNSPYCTYCRHRDEAVRAQVRPDGVGGPATVRPRSHWGREDGKDEHDDDWQDGGAGYRSGRPGLGMVPPPVREAARYAFLSLRTRSPSLSTHCAGRSFSIPRAWASARGIETENRPWGWDWRGGDSVMRRPSRISWHEVSLWGGMPAFGTMGDRSAHFIRPDIPLDVPNYISTPPHAIS